MRKQIYLDLKNRLKTILGPDEQPLFRHFDLWNQNVAFIEQETPFEVPALFIEFEPITWHIVGEGLQRGTLRIRLHVVTADYMQTADYSPMEHEALAYLDMLDRVSECLHMFEPHGCSPLRREESVTNHNHARYVDSMEVYSTEVTVIIPEN